MTGGRPGLEPGPGTRSTLARAKVNLFLRVLGRRADGYHDVESVILPISLADRLTVHADADPDVFRTLAFTLGVSGEPELVRRVPQDESNLVLRAAQELAREAAVRGFADFELEKRVPIAGGLGGGSADAAATLGILNDLWGCGLPPGRLQDVAARVGSDVPALMLEGGATVGGRGERVAPYPAPRMRWVLLAQPFGVRTADAFRWWDEDGRSPGPDPAPLLGAVRDGRLDEAGRLLFNDLEAAVTVRHPEVGEARHRLASAGALGAVLCGSGPTVAGLFPPDGEVHLEDGMEVWSG